jgi:hypothetical protein
MGHGWFVARSRKGKGKNNRGSFGFASLRSGKQIVWGDRHYRDTPYSLLPTPYSLVSLTVLVAEFGLAADHGDGYALDVDLLDVGADVERVAVG